MKSICVLLLALAMFSDSAWSISYGSEVEEGEFPFAVWIKPTFRPWPTCTGSVIAPTWVLTAAHCVITSNDRAFPPSVVQVGVGHDVFFATTVNVRTVVLHPDYGNPAIYPDAALLELASPVSVEPVSILSFAQESRYAKPGTMATLIGGGAIEDGSDSRVLRKAIFSIRSPSNCPVRRVAESAMCINIEGRTEPKGGDSGGPLVVRLPSDKWGQVGIAKGAVGGGVAHFTRTAIIRGWINRYVPLREEGSEPPVDSDQSYFQAAREKCLDPQYESPEGEPYTRCRLLPIIVQGGAWETEIEIRNSSKSEDASYKLIFRSDDSRGLHVRGGGLDGWVKRIEGSLKPLSVHTYTLSREHSNTTIEAEALIVRQKASQLPRNEHGEIVPGRDPYWRALISALITQHVVGRPPFQALLIPKTLRSNMGSNGGRGGDDPSYSYRYRNDGPYTTAMAFGSLLGRETESFTNLDDGHNQSLYYLARAYDEEGNQICSNGFAPGWNIAGRDANKTFLVRDLLPCTAGRKGFINFSANSNPSSLSLPLAGFVSFQVLVFHDQGPFFSY